MITDHIGSVRVVYDTTASTTAQVIQYDAWGIPTFVTGASNFQPFGFAGGIYDPDTGLVRFGARDYDPRVGRWMTKDGSRFRGGLNFYEYADDDPVNFKDATRYLPYVDHYLSPEGAAWSALNDIAFLNPAARRQVEWGGFIFRNPDGSYLLDRLARGPAACSTNESFGQRRRLPGWTSGWNVSHTHARRCGGPIENDYTHAFWSEFYFGEFHGYIGGRTGDLIGFDRHGVIFDTPDVFPAYEVDN